MERLTERERNYDGTGISKEDLIDATGLTQYTDKVLTKLADLEDAEEDGRLIVLPCKTVWFIVDRGTEYAMVMQKPIEYLHLYEMSKIDKDGRYYSTKEAAEQALQKMNGERQNERCK